VAEGPLQDRLFLAALRRDPFFRADAPRFAAFFTGTGLAPPRGLPLLSVSNVCDWKLKKNASRFPSGY